MSVVIDRASPADAPAIAALRNAAAVDLMTRFGKGSWCGQCTPHGVLTDIRRFDLYVARRDDHVIGTLTLQTRKPWAINRAYTEGCDHPIYLTSMAVLPEMQRQGIGRACLVAAREAAIRSGADAIFLDAFDAPAGAGEFYRKCGFVEIARAAYRGVQLVYFRLSLRRDTSATTPA